MEDPSVEGNVFTIGLTLRDLLKGGFLWSFMKVLEIVARAWPSG